MKLKCFNQIGKARGIDRRFSEKIPNLRVKRCEKHYVFYLKEADQTLLIVAVLHEKMDLVRRIRNWLDDQRNLRILSERF